jgi:hypothetical protein
LQADAKSWPKVNNMQEMVSSIQKEKIKYGILDLATVLHNQEVFGGYFTFNVKYGLVSLRPLPSIFKKLPMDPGMPPIYELYEFGA